jgi:hypothetical protein
VDLFDVAGACIRRWFVFWPLVLVALWYSNQQYAAVKPVYYSSAVVGFAPVPARAELPIANGLIPRNGLLDVGGAPLIANMTAIGLSDPSVRSQVMADGGASDYTAKIFAKPEAAGEIPLVMIEATEQDPTLALLTVQHVVMEANPLLQRLQQAANVPPDQMVTPFLVSPPSTPTAGMPSRIRYSIGVGLAGFGVAVLAALLADMVIKRWRARRQSKQSSMRGHRKRTTRMGRFDGSDNNAENARDAQTAQPPDITGDDIWDPSPAYRQEPRSDMDRR